MTYLIAPLFCLCIAGLIVPSIGKAICALTKALICIFGAGLLVVLAITALSGLSGVVAAGGLVPFLLILLLFQGSRRA